MLQKPMDQQPDRSAGTADAPWVLTSASCVAGTVAVFLQQSLTLTP